MVAGMNPRAALLSIWREITTPSAPNESAYVFFLVAVAHAHAGAAIFELSANLGLAAGVARLALPVGYWLIKERADRNKGGSLQDSMIDTVFIGLGGMAMLDHWHAIILTLALVMAIMRPRE